MGWCVCLLVGFVGFLFVFVLGGFFVCFCSCGGVMHYYLHFIFGETDLLRNCLLNLAVCVYEDFCTVAEHLISHAVEKA